MTDRMKISATEAGLVRVFAIDLPADAVAEFTDPDAPDIAAIRDALGAEVLSPDHVDFLRVTELGELGLDGYLVDGLGVAQDEIAADRARLRALRGYVLVLPSRAFAGTAQELSPRTPLRWIGTYAEPGPQNNFTPLTSAAAQGAPMPARPSDAAMSGRVAAIALLVMFLLVALVVWIAA
ncbi:aspartate carbamoyltransferase catalytic subunit [Lutimaribacter sp. EGI FJ00015]|uniref:Aspartate carbamoyltransferase catalytic subunit n=1 Tax=Lutimaribacter degradans TaxID=2945989 RepID=A0ACC5ZU62_9RHOB|nr:aspartate carbamoyltransferase catalytic subunit [Lutimaribacter sp. EGI FJ00013]MCM2561612.1 aspartate carbamoyltransferase catalytic subunit [Lutimaribacter sp. EGI FJ00013]MCO0612677.1 aspartate carbamoyltransferase catalytic subunit [Lutimaribacter sp. EGI FJ00015]MCO0635335.1 aspartate carbamoyltransferase catalytic subunit [Lutimaribacter sp. EGI FJ00014]